MKRITTLYFCAFLSFSIYAQNPDTSSLRLEIDSLIELNTSFLKKRKLDKAFELLIQAQEKCLQSFDEESLLNAKILRHLGIVHYYKRELSDVEACWLKAKDIHYKHLGKNHPLYAGSLNNLGIIYSDLGQYEKAETYYLEAIQIRAEVLGKEHPDYAGSLVNLGNLYKRMGDYTKTLEIFQKATDIWENIHGKEHPSYAKSLNNLGVVYNDIGEYDKAESCYLQTLAIREKIYDKDHYEIGEILNNLGVLYKDVGEYEKAESCYLRTTEIREKVFGKQHARYASILNNLGNLYEDMGEYEKAESSYLQTLGIWEKVYGKGHQKYAIILNNLGSMYKSMGQLDKVEKLYLETQEIWEQILGEEHPNYAKVLHNLGNLYLTKGLVEKAESYYLKTKELRESSLGKEHPEYAKTLNSLGILYKNSEQFDKAQTYLKQTIEIQEKTIGTTHPDYAHTLHNLGHLYAKMNQHDSAEKYYLNALHILEEVFGRNHADCMVIFHSLANLYVSDKKYQLAKEYYLEANELQTNLFLNAANHLSESELSQYVNSYTNHLDQFFSIIEHEENLAGKAYNNCLFYKGLILNTTRQMNRLAKSDSLSNNMLLKLKSYKRLLGKEYSKSIEQRDSAKILDLEQKSNSLEKEITRLVSGYESATQQISWQSIQESLKPGEAAIEFFNHHYYNPESTDSVKYFALLIKGGMSQVTFIPLFEEQSLIDLIGVNQKRRSDYVNELYSIEGRGSTVLSKSKKNLYELIWEPLKNEVNDINTIYFSPSGLLHRINLSAISVDHSNTISDQYKLVQLNSTRDLAIDFPDQTNDNNAIIYGGIQYDIQSNQIDTKNNDPADVLNNMTSAISMNSKDNSRGDNWQYLNWTLVEIEEIQNILENSNMESNSYTLSDATENAFKLIGENDSSPRVLHLATHGFFFPDLETENIQMNDNAIFKNSNNSMIRSGLLLAGANYVWQGNNPKVEGEDGILTAYEISQMDLSQTELVVLSACETGLGDIKGNEGVYGLQRAFKIAGVKYLIMSLWQVPDRQTKDFMISFYKNWLEGKMNIRDAFSKTQKQMKDRFYDPYFWAGFVLVE